MPLQSQIFTADGTFTVPADVTAVMLQLVGPGGGGRGSQGAGFGPGGHAGSAAEFALNLFSPVVAGATVAITVGTGGTGAVGFAAATPGVGNATFGSVIALPARGPNEGYPSAPTGNGGGIGGGDSHAQNDQAFGTAESVTYFGGCGGAEGGGGGISSGNTGFSNADTCGGPPGTYIFGITNYPGSGGSAAVWPTGGTGGTGARPATPAASTNGLPGTGYGSGGGGGGDGESYGPASNGGHGSKGAVVVYWMGP